jgi:hypothetical protein
MQEEKQKGQEGTKMARVAFFAIFAPFLPFLLPLQRQGICQVSCQGKAGNNDFAKALSG